LTISKVPIVADVSDDFTENLQTTAFLYTFVFSAYTSIMQPAYLVLKFGRSSAIA